MRWSIVKLDTIIGIAGMHNEGDRRGLSLSSCGGHVELWNQMGDIIDSLHASYIGHFLSWGVALL